MATIRKKQSDIDIGRIEVDEQLKSLETRLSDMYQKAGKEAEADFDKFMERYKDEDKQKKKELRKNQITQSQYDDWKNRQVFRSEAMKAQIDDLSNRLTNVDKQAMAMINGELPSVYATSYNYGGFRGEMYAQAAGYDYTQFTIVNDDAVRILANEDPDLIPWKKMPDKKKNLAWNRQHVQSAISQGIVSGDSMNDIAKRLMSVVNMDERAAIRTARTAVNGVENKGRKDATQRVRDAGIPMIEEWHCNHDSKTRDTHILLDKTVANEDGYFGDGILNKLMEYPGDPNGEPSEVYNCRCCLMSRLEGIDHSKDEELYEKFMDREYSDDWKKVKEQRSVKEQGFKEKKAGAADRVFDKKQRAVEKKQNREEAMGTFKKLGFDKFSSGVSKIDDRLLVSTSRRLEELDKKYGAFTSGMKLSTGSSKRIYANARYDYETDGPRGMKMSTYYFGSEKRCFDMAKRNVDMGWFMPTDDKHLTVMTMTHEYGHLVQAKTIKTGSFRKAVKDKRLKEGAIPSADYGDARFMRVSDIQRKEIIAIAKEKNPNLNIDELISEYGKSDSREFFAEVFSNAHCGAPNELGKAMLEWLKRRGF